MAVQYAKERFTFGRPIGSYQAVKHGLTEVLRQLDNGRSLLYYAGWAGQSSPEEFPLAASALRSAAGRALDFAARDNISVHGGIGATWSTTRRTSSAARSCRAGCWAARTTPPTAWRRSSSPRRRPSCRRRS